MSSVLEVMEMFMAEIVMIVSWEDTYLQSHQVVDIKYVQLFINQSYFNAVNFFKKVWIKAELANTTQAHDSWHIKWPDELNLDMGINFIATYILYVHKRKGNLNVFQIDIFFFFIPYVISIQIMIMYFCIKFLKFHIFAWLYSNFIAEYLREEKLSDPVNTTF